jgi:hypothetical protein
VRIPGKLGVFTTFYGQRFDIEGGIFQQGKSCSLADQGARYQNTVFGKACEESPASP